LGSSSREAIDDEREGRLGLEDCVRGLLAEVAIGAVLRERETARQQGGLEGVDVLSLLMGIGEAQGAVAPV
jgi:hypothetical protein